MKKYKVNKADKTQHDFAPVPNIFLSDIPFSMNSNCFKILMYFVKMTFGFHRCYYSIGIDRIAKECNMSYSIASHWLNYLVKKGWIIITRKADRRNKITREYTLITGEIEV